MIESGLAFAAVYVAGTCITDFLIDYIDDDFAVSVATTFWPISICVIVLYWLAIGARRLFDRLRGRA